MAQGREGRGEGTITPLGSFKTNVQLVLCGELCQTAFMEHLAAVHFTLLTFKITSTFHRFPQNRKSEIPGTTSPTLLEQCVGSLRLTQVM